MQHRHVLNNIPQITKEELWICGRDRMVVGFINTRAISAYHH